MPSDLTVRAVAAVAQPLAAEPAAAQPGMPGTQAAARPLPNPTMRLDEQLGIVVLEFHNASGAVTSSIPTERQLDAYRASLRTEGNPPAALAGAGTGTGTGAAAPPQPGAEAGHTPTASPAAPAGAGHTDLSR
jgi:hypothetical protein